MIALRSTNKQAEGPADRHTCSHTCSIYGRQHRWLIDWLTAQRSLRLQQWGFTELGDGLELQNNNHKNNHTFPEQVHSRYTGAQTTYELLDSTLAAALNLMSNYASKSFNGTEVSLLWGKFITESFREAAWTLSSLFLIMKHMLSRFSSLLISACCG